jgi:predicted membrane protein
VDRKFIALLLIALGTLFLLDTTNAFGVDVDILGTYWPALLIVLGLWGLVRQGIPRLWAGYGWERRFTLWPIILLAIGVVFLLTNLSVWDLDIGQLWPVILVAVGLVLLLNRQGRPRSRRRDRRQDSPGPEAINGGWEVAHVFSGGQEEITSQEFSGGEVSAVFGRVELDLRRAGLAEGKATIDATAVFGGIELRVPRDWRVNIQTTTVFGGTENKHRQPSLEESTGELTITGSVLFGELKVQD